MSGVLGTAAEAAATALAVAVADAHASATAAAHWIGSDEDDPQSCRYADLSLKEEDLIKTGQHVLVTYTMKPQAGHDYLATAAHFAAEASAGASANECALGASTEAGDTRVYYIDPEHEVMKIAYPTAICARNLSDDRARTCSISAALL